MTVPYESMNRKKSPCVSDCHARSLRGCKSVLLFFCILRAKRGYCGVIVVGKGNVASRASWYQLAIFESYFSNPNSKCLLGCAQPPFDLHRADAGRAFVPNTSITKKDSLGLSHNGRILGCHRLSGLCFFDGVLFFCKEQFYVTLRTKKFLHLVFRFTVIRVGCFLFRQQLGIFCI